MENQVTNITISKKEKVIKRTTSYAPDVYQDIEAEVDTRNYGAFSQFVVRACRNELARIKAERLQQQQRAS